MLQLITSRYDDRHWRKKIEKTLSLPQSGVSDPTQQQIFMYLKIELKAYKSRRADPDSWSIGGYATKEVIDRAKFQPHLVGPEVKKDDVAFLGADPGDDVRRLVGRDAGPMVRCAGRSTAARRRRNECRIRGGGRRRKVIESLAGC